MPVDPAGKAQELFWEIQRYERAGVPIQGLAIQYCEIARLYHSIAFRDLDSEGIGSWPDLFAAITHFAQAGEIAVAERLLAEGRSHSPVGHGRLAELDELASWVAAIPAATDYQRIFAELAVNRVKGTVSASEAARLEDELALLLNAMPDALRLSVEQWRNMQAARPTGDVSATLSFVTTKDVASKPFEVAA